MERHERLFNAVGWLGLLVLVPIAFYVLEFAPARDFMADRLGFAGRPVFLTLLGFSLILVRILFGGEKSLLPLVLGFVIGFLLISTFARIGFMGWFFRRADPVIFLRSGRLNYFVGLGVLLLGMVLSYVRRPGFLAQLLGLVVVPAAALLVLNALGVLPA
ncbi:MAG: hypothetical protein JW820_17445 [Spirochaetales bacterium]|nr:hypothetical protein [Spirochaetales bacterium]